MNTPAPKPHIRRQQGAALMMTLVLAGLMAIFVIAYLGSMRDELGAAAAYEQTQSAKVLSQSAISHGIELLRTNIPDPALISERISTANPELWVSNPGRLTIIEGNNEPRHVALHTGAVEEEPGTGPERDLLSVDLNRPLAGEDYPPITVALDERGMPDPESKRPEMRVLWRNVLRDPSQAAAKENQIVGRYAFWMDDESGKLNFNVAGGKTPLGQVDTEDFHSQLATGMMTPLFNLGTNEQISYAQGANRRRWALGQSRSVNLDVLTEDSDELDVERLLEQAWLHGFSRYPEAIMDFVNTSDPADWYHQRKYNLTFYSRSQEFNMFGRSRFFTTKRPLSLESGPNYQLPFVAGSSLSRPGDGPLHLHALMSLGQAKNIENPNKDDVEQRAHNVVNQSQVDMLMGYMRRVWPGHSQSFVDKYGEGECYQMSVSLILWARIALAAKGNTLAQSTATWAQRTTSSVYAPPKEERPGAYPQRHYWRFNVNGQEELFLPQQPGPHITEVRLKFQLEDAGAGKYRVKFRHQSEFYMHPFGPQLLLRYFPVSVDYLKIEPSSGDEWEVGTTDPDSTDPDRNWNHGTSLGRLRASGSGQIRPSNSFLPNVTTIPRFRAVVASPFRYIGKADGFVPKVTGQGQVFDLGSGSLNLDFKIRLGMSVSNNPRRPRQMIPLGDTDRDDHVLNGTVTLDEFEPEGYVTFHIPDPRLSGTKEAWVRLEGDEGTLGRVNPDEPAENSSEKSKFRFFSAGRGAIRSATKDRGHALHRGDEFVSFSPVSSIGYWSILHTGIHSNVPWRTLSLGPSNTQISSNPPDSVLLDLFGSTYPMQHDQWRIDATLPDSFSTVSYMNSTAGQINLNTRVYPQSEWFQAPERKKPLEAVFKHLRPDAEVDDFVDNVVDYQSDDQFFNQIGELAEVEGYERSQGYITDQPTQFEKEEILRNMAGCLTTNSNTFSLWGVAQVVTKRPRPGAETPPSYGTMEVGDSVRSEKRFFALIERYIWPGKDGVPGNGHVSAEGTWDRIAQPNGNITKEVVRSNGDTSVVDRLFDLPGSPALLPPAPGGIALVYNAGGTLPEFDGPEEVGMDPYSQRVLGRVDWRNTDLIDAYNPPQAVIKYRVVYFKYLDS